MKNVISQVFECFNTGETNGIEDLILPEYYSRNAAGAPQDCLAPGPAGFVAMMTWLRGAFSDLHFEELETIADGDRVMVRVIMSGRHTQDFQGLPASGRSFSVQQVHIFRLADGKLLEHRSIRDDLELLRQLGATRAIQPAFVDRPAVRFARGPERLRVV